MQEAPAGSEPDELLTPRDVAELFGVDTSTIKRWAQQGQLRAVETPGGHRRYRRKDIEDALRHIDQQRSR